MIPDNSKRKLEQLRQEAAFRAQLQQQYDKEMSGKYTRDMPSFQEWLDKRPKPMAKGGSTSPVETTVKLGDRELPITMDTWDKRAGNKIVHVNPETFDKAFKKSSWQYVGPQGEGGIKDRYSKFADYAKSAKSAHASNADVNKEGVITFGDGRHRYAYMRDQGVDKIPMSMSKQSIEHARRHGYLHKAEGGSVEDDYRSEHKAPGPHFGAPMHDVTREMYPKDFYSANGLRYYADHTNPTDRDAYNKVTRVKGKPNEMVSIHRAIPTKVYNEALKKDAPLKHMIRKGDWVAINKNYAKEHGEGVLLGDYKIASMRVPAKHVWTNADSIHEWGYHPDEKATGGIIRKAEGGKVEPTQDEMRLALTKRHGMYSPLERLAIDIPRNKGTGAEFMAEISKRPGFKPEEVADRKIPIPEGKMTKAEFVKHLQSHSNPPLREDIRHGMDEDQREERLRELMEHHGYESYAEVPSAAMSKFNKQIDAEAAQYDDPSYNLPGGKNYREILLSLPERKPNPKNYRDPAAYDRDMKAFNETGDQDYISSHWKDDPNVLAHMRLSDRRGPKGEKLLHLEELQSDWHQHGRKKGYKSDVEDLTPMEQARREELAKKIRHGLATSKELDENEALRRREIKKIGSVPDAPFKKSWHELGMKHVLHHAAKHGYHGVVITPGEEQARRWKDEGLKVHYDKKIPEFLNKFGKPHGVQLQMHGHRIKGDPFDYGKATEDLGLGHIWMTDLTPEQNQQIADKADKKLHYFPITEPMRTSILKEGMPQYVRGGVVHKAEGGAVLPIEQIKAQMMKKFNGLSTLQSVGAEEAPSLGIKAYVPTTGRPDNGQMPVGGIDTQQGDLPVGGIDMNTMQAGQQLMPTPVAGTQQGMDQVPAGDKINTMDGTGMPPTPNSNPNQMGSNILSMTPQGQAMAAMKPQGLAKGGKVDVRPTVFDDKATRRIPQIETAVKALQAGIINQKEYDRIVQKYKPVKPYDFVPAPATDEDALQALISTKKPKWRTHESWPEGHPVGLRLDIPSYQDHGVWVNSIHDERGGKDKFPVSYGPVSAVRNATFEGTPEKGLEVATGERSKAPFAKIMGELEHIDEKKAIAHMKKFLNHPEYRQIGYDPRRHGDFYDRETMQPVESAEHVVQIGPLVLAKKPTYAKARTKYAEGGSLHYEPAKPLSKQEIEEHADRIARQITGEDNPNKKSKQQMDREKTLQVDIKSGGKEVPMPVINHEDIKGSSMVGVPGDPSRGGVVPRKRNSTRLGVNMPKAGEYLRGVGGQKLEGDVPMLGGYKYGAYGHPNAWASDLGASAGLYNVVKKLYEENPEADIYGQYHKMTPASLNHAVHTLDAVLSHHQPHNAPPEVIENLNHLMRNVKTTTGKHDVPYPTFPGFENPNEVMLHGMMNSGMRKKMIGLLSKDKYLAGGKQKMDDLIFALTHPELRNIETGAGGSAIMQFDPTQNLKESLSPHTTYGHDLPTKLKGRTRYITPFQLLAPRSNANAIKEIKAMGKEKTVVPFNQAKMNIIREPIDEQYINQLGEYELAMKKRLGYKSGGKVKLHTDQDTMQLALTKKSKKAK